MHGLMMDMPLAISDLIRHADRHHGAGEIVSKTVEEAASTATPTARRTGARAGWRARSSASASACATASRRWPGTAIRHFEIYYGVAGSGAVIHTINPRLFPDQIAYIANHAEDKVAVLRPDLRCRWSRSSRRS